jgi:hypothetical protein
MTAPTASAIESHALQAEPESTEVFHVEHHGGGTGQSVELARYSVTVGGQRVLYRQRCDGHVRVVDRPVGAGRSYLVERELELDGPEAIDAIVADYVRQARRFDAVPMRASVVRRHLEDTAE